MEVVLRVTTVLSLGGSIKPIITIGSREVGEVLDGNNARQLWPVVVQVTSALPFDSLLTVMPSDLGGEFGSLEDSEEMVTQKQLNYYKRRYVYKIDTLVDSPLLKNIVSLSAATDMGILGTLILLFSRSNATTL